MSHTSLGRTAVAIYIVAQYMCVHVCMHVYICVCGMCGMDAVCSMHWLFVGNKNNPIEIAHKHGKRTMYIVHQRT